MFTCGIIGLPNVGKSTVFNALTRAGAQVSNYPFCTVEPNQGMVAVPDERLEKLAALVKSDDITPTTIKFLDIAGLVKGASHGEGLGNQFLAHIREVEALIHVVRCFQAREVAHIAPDIAPERDIEIVELELALSDLEMLERRLNQVEKMIKSGEEGAEKEKEVLLKVRSFLEKGRSLSSLDLSPEEEHLTKSWNLLSLKPVIYLANIGEEMNPVDISDVKGVSQPLIKSGASPYVQKVRGVAEREGRELVYVSAKLEAEIAELGEEGGGFRKEMGISSDSGLTKLIRVSYRLLDLVTFYTVARDKVRAWTIPEGTKVKEAAGKVHSDMEKGFIRAEVISFPDLERMGSLANAREKGLVRIEGKDYLVKDGDVIYFRFQS